MRPFAPTHTRSGSHTHVRAAVFAGSNPANARLNHCHLTDWPVSVVLVKKKVPLTRRISAFSCLDERSFVFYCGNSGITERAMRAREKNLIRLWENLKKLSRSVENTRIKTTSVVRLFIFL